MKRLLLIGAYFILASALTNVGFAATGDEPFDTAWKFEMSRESDANVKRSGTFRIDGSDVYQPRQRKMTKIGVIEGKKNGVQPKKGDKIKVDFEELRATDDTILKCRGPITWESRGNVQGRLTDSDNVVWNFKAIRVQTK